MNATFEKKNPCLEKYLSIGNRDGHTIRQMMDNPDGSRKIFEAMDMPAVVCVCGMSVDPNQEWPY